MGMRTEILGRREELSNLGLNFEVHTAVKIPRLVFYIVTPCRLKGRQRPTFQRNTMSPSSVL
jgi:hypothetical protein